MCEEKKQLERLKELPGYHKGEKIIATMTIEFPFLQAPDREVEALGLPFGRTVKSLCRTHGVEFNVYATDDIADQVVGLPGCTEITAELKCVFGTYTEVEHGVEGPITHAVTVSGLLIEAIKEIKEFEF